MDNVAINKMMIIENCLKRIREEYVGHEKEFLYNYTKQDSIILNLQRACEAAIDLATRIIRLKRLGLPQSSREVFVILEKSHLLSCETSHKMQAMVGFRNIAVHDYQKVNYAVVESILKFHLMDFETFIKDLKPNL